jgi:hypothetical protein
MKKRTTPANPAIADALLHLYSNLEELDLIASSIRVIATDEHAARIELRFAADGGVTIGSARPTRAEQRARREQRYLVQPGQLLMFPEAECLAT